MKKKLLISLLSGAGIMAASAWATPSYQLASGYGTFNICLLYTSPSPRDRQKSRMPSSA